LISHSSISDPKEKEIMDLKYLKGKFSFFFIVRIYRFYQLLSSISLNIIDHFIF
jgi:hypothetical protein